MRYLTMRAEFVIVGDVARRTPTVDEEIIYKYDIDEDHIRLIFASGDYEDLRRESEVLVRAFVS